jgi:outer membrane protein assembly factor BamB
MFARSVVLFGAVLAVAAAQDWPQWRGAHRDGVAASALAPKVWPEKLKLKWKVTLGEGHSSPVVSAGKVYLHTRQGERELLSCLKPETGQVIWQQSYAAPYRVNPVAASHGPGVKSTPVVAGGRICTLGIGGIVSCFDAATGKPLWHKSFSSPEYGTAMSPLIDRSLLIANVEIDRGGALKAFDVETGQEKWSWNGDGSSYASPVVAELAGVRQVVAQTRRKIVGLSAENGQLLWETSFTTAYDQNIVTPVLYGDLLIFSGLRAKTFAVKVVRNGSRFSTQTVWENGNTAMYMSSPVLSGDLLFGMTNRNSGQFFCLDARTGATLWTSDGRQGDNAAIVDAGGALLVLTTNAELLAVEKNARSFRLLRKYPVATSPTWAHAVPLHNAVLIKDATTLSRWEFE